MATKLLILFLIIFQAYAQESRRSDVLVEKTTLEKTDESAGKNPKFSDNDVIQDVYDAFWTPDGSLSTQGIVLFVFIAVISAMLMYWPLVLIISYLHCCSCGCAPPCCLAC